MLRWPDAETVVGELSRWADALVRERSDVERVGCIGSYARGDAGPGSDLDVIVVLHDTELPFIERAATIDATSLPVPTDLLVYTSDELARLTSESTRFGRVLREEARWAWPR